MFQIKGLLIRKTKDYSVQVLVQYAQQHNDTVTSKPQLVWVRREEVDVFAHEPQPLEGFRNVFLGQQDGQKRELQHPINDHPCSSAVPGLVCRRVILFGAADVLELTVPDHPSFVSRQALRQVGWRIRCKRARHKDDNGMLQCFW